MFVYSCYFFAVIICVKSASAPFIKPCQVTDGPCTKASAQAAVPVVAPGIPELGIKSLDPMHLDVIKGDQGGLQLTFKDTTITGLKGCNVESAKVDLKKGKQSLTIRCSVTLKGNYKLGGQLLVLPIQGEGKYDITIQDIVIKAYTDLSTVDGADGKPHWHIANWKHTYQVKTSTHFNFENLFNGNKVLGQSVIDFANGNWRDVMSEVAPPIVRAIVSAVVDAVEALFAAVPADQLYVA